MLGNRHFREVTSFGQENTVCYPPPVLLYWTLRTTENIGGIIVYRQVKSLCFMVTSDRKEGWGRSKKA